MSREIEPVRRDSNVEKEDVYIERFLLSEVEYEAFLALLDHPPELDEAVKARYRRKLAWSE
jgi:uncharacterized protein (DUF1778 family)